MASAIESIYPIRAKTAENIQKTTGFSHDKRDSVDRLLALTMGSTSIPKSYQ